MVLTGTDRSWSVARSAELYGLDRWGDPYFSINSKGNVVVQPRGDRGGSLDLMELLKGLEARDLQPPLLIRFDDILEDRLERLHAAFDRAIAHYDYGGRYQGVFPIKCNQQRHVVEHLVEAGQRWNFGLEAGSKAELLIALSPVTQRLADLQWLQRPPLHRNGDPGQAAWPSAGGGDRTDR